MKYIIDRFEGNFAVVELKNKRLVNIPREAIPEKAKEGDVVRVEIDESETQRRKHEIDEMTKGMWIE
jgi:exoribonuclease R